ncbi:phosphorylase domain protein [Leptospira weilii str. Ecochallenge]|uniref:Phosphorylase domain protein n=1 Tax=Leptospira weilii str. Ecochallenge TaxID=1049986 RepID=N1U1F0_9LEPT|nr:phosphorylase domain protein [Leptospira weilii str. Ecochallenge]
MIFISAALFPEAKPLIETLGLKILRDKTPFPIYRNEKYILVVSGAGKIFSAMSVVFLLNEFKNSVVDSSWILNFGICGAPKESFKIGESFLIHKIKDEGSSKSVYPDILFKSPIPESVLLTVDKPVFRNEISELPNTLVDMEAFGFFKLRENSFLRIKFGLLKLFRIILRNWNLKKKSESSIRFLLELRRPFRTSFRFCQSRFQKETKSSFNKTKSPLFHL